MIAHVAIPAYDLDESIQFYQSIGAKLGRTTEQSAIFNFYGMQLVLHKSGRIETMATMYPRHVGVIVEERLALKNLWLEHQSKHYVFEKYFVRNEAGRNEHHTFFLKDPSNNTVEFKWYRNQLAIFS